MMLWPQACPIPGSASYSAQMPITNGPLPNSARNAVSNPPGAAVISKPRSATNACALAQLLNSAKASSGSAWMACDSSMRSPLRRLTASSTLADAVAVGIIAVSHCQLSCPTVTDPDAIALQAAAAIRERTGVDRHDVAVILGSGLGARRGGVGRADGRRCRWPNCPDSLPRPPRGTAAMSCRSGRAITECWCSSAGSTPTRATTCATSCIRFVRRARRACTTVVLTNAAGGLRDDFAVGQPVLISDHLNLTASSPLVGPQFVDLVDAYSPRLRALAREVDPTLAEGVYAGLPGPHYETPAEIRMLRTLGADLVGMSTVHETIAARAAGARVLAVSLVTNVAAGMTGQPLSHEEVLAAGRQSATRTGSLLASVISRL